jgi:alpha-1,6-mannosyltransferase
VSLVWIIGPGLALLATFAAMAAVGDLFRHAGSFLVLVVAASAAYGVAAVAVVRRPPGGRWFWLVLWSGALAFRLVLLPTTPSLSTDLYRYVWEGRVAAAGISPYRYPPNAPELVGLRDGRIFPGVNHADWPTIYPPGAQLLFHAMARLAPDSVLGFKLLILGCDLLTLGVLLAWLRALGRPTAWALLYAWHPLVVVELAGSGHLDAVALAASVGALWAATRGWQGWAGGLIGAAGLVKLYPLVLLPAVVGRRPGRAVLAGAAVVLGGYAVYAREGWAVVGSLPRYLADEEFNGALRALLQLALASLGPAGEVAARMVPLAGLAALAVGIAMWAGDWPVWRRALWLTGAYLLATPNLFPWYLLWIVPIAAVAPAWPWLYLACAVSLTYVIFTQPVWTIPGWVVAVEFVPFALGLALAARPTRPSDASAPAGVQMETAG